MVVFCGSIYGQATSTDPVPKLTPQGPEVSVFNKFIDMPVSLHTGVPDISIPIYEIKLRDISIPISLNYHSSGIKVDEPAPNTGLGWSLSGMGNVSQSINGVNDYGANIGWVNTLAKTPQTGLIKTFFGLGTTPVYTSDPRYDFNKSVTDGLIDSEPDLFYFSMPGKSGKFFFDQERNVHTMPYQCIKVTPSSFTNTTQNAYTIVDERGNTYIYGQFELTSSTLTSNCGGTSFPESSFTAVLTKIITLSNDTIDFVYSDEIYDYKGQISENRSVRVTGNSDCPTDTRCTSTSVVHVAGKRISDIYVSDGQHVHFNYSSVNRLDLAGDRPLSEILISSSGLDVQRHQLFYSYFTSPDSPTDASLKYWLKLDSVTKNGQETYRLEYDQTPMPARLSLAQDYCGYYNGAIENTTLLPKNLAKGFYDGADRETNPLYIKAGSLKKIIYPTGGHTLLDLEANTYHYYGNSSTVESNSHYAMPSSQEYAVTTFQIPISGRDFKSKWKITGGGNFATLTGPNGYSQTFTGTNNTLSFNTTLPAGNYTLTFSYVTDPFDLSDDFVQINWVYDKLNQVAENKPTGGLRIKRTDFVPGNGSMGFSKNYVYAHELTPAVSSGKLIYQPKMEYESWRYSSSIESSTQECRYNTQSSSSVAPLGTIQGGNVVYDYVSVYNTSKEGNGMTSYEYINEGMPTQEYNDPDITGVKFPFAPRIMNDGQNGLLKTVKSYSYDPQVQKMKLISRKDNTYKKTIGEGPNEFSIRGVKIGILFPPPCTSTACGPATFAADYYFLNSSWSYLTSETDSTFNSTGPPVVSSVSYYYDNPLHIQLTRKKMVGSDGKAVYSAFTYPADYAAGTPFIDDLKLKNNTTVNIEQVSYVDGASGRTIAGGSINEYFPGGKALLRNTYRLNTNGISGSAPFKFSGKPSGMSFENPGQFAFEMDSRYEKRVAFNNYDHYGNIMNLSAVQGTNAVYLWSYKGRYMIAEIKNGDYQAVVNLLGGQVAVDNLSASNPTDAQVNALLAQLRSSFPQASITGYTYKPLVGMTSSTDAKGMTTYYEYDTFQRLKAIKDQNGNILKQTDYHYKN
ncbi:hypothetical protein ACFSR6_02490 [Pedobacter vanadiisoli]|uniref:YD repeat-containing protein n=1 Tax=Pedobacter vanadiisoli TaxID=1761975 RepID=A0ABW5MFV5_9SPHI